MPHEASLPPSTRFYARLDRFQCECPRCGELIIVGEQGNLPKRLRTLALQRGLLKSAKRNGNPEASDRTLARHVIVYNPLSQRLRCPFCEAVFSCGLLLYTMPRVWQRRAVAPLDTIPNRRILAALRHMANGWWRTRLDQRDESQLQVNTYVTEPCQCAPADAAVPTCPIHGTTTLATAEHDLDPPATLAARAEFAPGLPIRDPRSHLYEGEQAKVGSDADEVNPGEGDPDLG